MTTKKFVGHHALISRPHNAWELEKKRNTVLAIPDLHAPFHQRNALTFLKELKDYYQPDVVVCLGDEVDMAFWSFHDKDPHMPGAKEEYYGALEFMGRLYELFPNVLCCTSNHTARPYRVGHKFGLLSDFLRGYHEILQAPKSWAWMDRILIDGVCYEHGENVSGRNAAWQAMMGNGCSTVIGHIHGHAGVQYTANPFNQKFALNSGCLIDPEALAFRYGNKYRNKATLGASVVINGEEAYFVKMFERLL